jgi:hypothetical protein
VLNQCAAPHKNAHILKKEPPIEYIVDCTLGYPKGVLPGLGEAMLGEWPNDDSTVSIHYKVHKVDPEWSTDEMALKEWLYEQYKVKVMRLSTNSVGRFSAQKL